MKKKQKSQFHENLTKKTSKKVKFDQKRQPQNHKKYKNKQNKQKILIPTKTDQKKIKPDQNFQFNKKVKSDQELKKNSKT